mmetsp:Transcript_23137/g.40020  ORF Transcript_23137/g.40020 Transcript_23137/m.40020 type:complete len:319 (+) Transcript_23137:588-1544(+)
MTVLIALKSARPLRLSSLNSQVNCTRKEDATSLVGTAEGSTTGASSAASSALPLLLALEPTCAAAPAEGGPPPLGPPGPPGPPLLRVPSGFLSFIVIHLVSMVWMSLNCKSSIEAPYSSTVTWVSRFSNIEKEGSKNFFKMSTFTFLRDVDSAPLLELPLGPVRAAASAVAVPVLSSSSSTSSTSPVTLNMESSSWRRLRWTASSRRRRCFSCSNRYAASSSPASSMRIGRVMVAITGGVAYFCRNSAASEPGSEASIKITRQRGSPPHFSNNSLDSPLDMPASVASTHFGPGQNFSISRKLVANRICGRSNGLGLPL